MLNTFQFLSKYMSIKTLVRLHSITNDMYLKKTTIKRLGFYPLSLNNLEDDYLLNFRKSLNVYKYEENLHLYSEDEAIHCNLKKDTNSSYKINVYFSELRDINVFKKMMINFKRLFEEFYLETCEISHSPDLVIRLKLKEKVYIDIPAYFHCIVVKNSKFVKIK